MSLRHPATNEFSAWPYRYAALEQVLVAEINAPSGGEKQGPSVRMLLLQTEGIGSSRAKAGNVWQKF